MNEQQLLADCLRRLNRSGVTYYLTGSMASNFWGIPRTTHDLDFVVQLPAAAVPRIVQEFSGDFYLEEAAVRAAYQPPHQFNAIDTRSALKVDFWLPKPEPFDREMLRRRVRVTLFGEPAWRRTSSCTSSSGSGARLPTASWAMRPASWPCRPGRSTKIICGTGRRNSSWAVNWNGC
jgi:hypothetical protein